MRMTTQNQMLRVSRHQTQTYPARMDCHRKRMRPVTGIIPKVGAAS